jgi:hypothetical protein
MNDLLNLRFLQCTSLSRHFQPPVANGSLTGASYREVDLTTMALWCDTVRSHPKGGDHVNTLT